MSKLLENFKPIKLSMQNTIEVINMYFNESPEGELKQKFIEKLCRTTIMDPSTNFAGKFQNYPMLF